MIPMNNKNSLGSRTPKMEAKKSLGQHWLKEEKYLNAIVDAAHPSTDDVILEIGPGTGLLTEKLLKLSGKVIAVEKDRELITGLREKFKNEIKEGKLDLIEKDILDFDPSTKLRTFGPEALKSYNLPYAIVANIPYYITGAIIKKFLTTDHQPRKMTILVQKEVAERIVARDGKESVLSISIKAYGEPRLIGKVPAGAFSPPPKVDSAIIEIANISKKLFLDAKIQEKSFFKVVRVGFSSKRKTLLNNFGALFGRNDTKIMLKQCQIAENTRAERLTLENWLCLTKEFTKITKK